MNFKTLYNTYMRDFNNSKLAKLLALSHPEIDKTSVEEFINNSSNDNEEKCNDFCIIDYNDNNDNVFAVDHKGDMLSFASKLHSKKQCKGKKCNGSFKLIPNFKGDRDVIYISGPSGAGKTYWAKDFAKNYKVAFPNNKVLGLSNKDIENVNMLPIEIPKQMKDYENSLIIFDDIENISSNKDAQNECIKFLEECLNVGRSLHISCIVISHVIMNYRLTRNIIMEAKYIIIFPMSGLNYQYRNFLNKYVGLDKKQIDELLKTKKRWIIVHKHCPVASITDTDINCL